MNVNNITVLVWLKSIDNITELVWLILSCIVSRFDVIPPRNHKSDFDYFPVTGFTAKGGEIRAINLQCMC